MCDQKEKNNLNKDKINYKEEVSTDFFDYYYDDEPYQDIQIT